MSMARMGGGCFATPLGRCSERGEDWFWSDLSFPSFLRPFIIDKIQIRHSFLQRGAFFPSQFFKTDLGLSLIHI